MSRSATPIAYRCQPLVGNAHRVAQTNLGTGLAHDKTQTPSPGHPALGHGSHVGAAHRAQPSLVVTGLQPALTHAKLSGGGGQPQMPLLQVLVQHWLFFLHALLLRLQVSALASC